MTPSRGQEASTAVSETGLGLLACLHLHFTTWYRRATQPFFQGSSKMGAGASKSEAGQNTSGAEKFEVGLESL